jgi:hypothetical protein
LLDDSSAPSGWDLSFNKDMGLLTIIPAAARRTGKTVPVDL